MPYSGAGGNHATAGPHCSRGRGALVIVHIKPRFTAPPSHPPLVVYVGRGHEDSRSLLQ
jgi:hypothetical protein